MCNQYGLLFSTLATIGVVGTIVLLVSLVQAVQWMSFSKGCTRGVTIGSMYEWDYATIGRVMIGN